VRIRGMELIPVGRLVDAIGAAMARSMAADAAPDPETSDSYSGTPQPQIED
jgi:DNA repair protein RadA/Sms